MLFCGWPVMVDDTHTRRRTGFKGAWTSSASQHWDEASTQYTAS